MQSDNGRVELHRHSECAERALQTHPYESERGPPRRDRPSVAACVPPGQRHDQGNDRPQDRSGITVDHLDPCFLVRDWPGGHGCLCFVNFIACAQGADTAITTWPIGAAEARVGQAGEGSEQHQVEGEEQGDQGQRTQASRRRLVPVLGPVPGQGNQRQTCGQEQQLAQGIEVVEGVHEGCESAPCAVPR